MNERKKIFFFKHFNKIICQYIKFNNYIFLFIFIFLSYSYQIYVIWIVV